MIEFTATSTFATRATMGDVRKGDLLHIEDADGSFRQMIVTQADRKGAMVTFAAKMTNPDVVLPEPLTLEQYRAMTAQERRAADVASQAAHDAWAKTYWSATTHRAATPVAKALGRTATVAYKKP